MKNLIEQSFKEKNWAVIGATNNTSKFGNKIFKRLKNYGFNVVPINPVYEEVENTKALDCVSELQDDVSVLNVVVSPEKSMAMLDNIDKTSIKYVWFQPGTYNNEVIEKANQLGLNVIYNYCVLVESRSL